MSNSTKYFLFIFLALFSFTACEDNTLEELQQLDEAGLEAKKISTDSETTQKDYKGRIRRIRLREKNNGLYRITGYVPNTSNQVVETSLEVLTDVDATLEFRKTNSVRPGKFILKRVGETKDGKHIKYVADNVKFEGNPNGLLFKTTTTVLDAKGQAISKPVIGYSPAVGRTNFFTGTPKLKRNRKEDSFSLSTRISMNRVKRTMILTQKEYSERKIEEISDDEAKEYMYTFKFTARLTPTNGGSKTKEREILFGFLEIERGFTLQNSNIYFGDATNVEGMEYTVSFAILNSDGEVIIDDKIYRIDEDFVYTYR